MLTTSLTVSLDRPVYTKCQCQHCDNPAMMLAIPFSLKTIESLQDWVAIHFQVTSLISMRIELSSLMAELSLMLSVNGPFRG